MRQAAVVLEAPNVPLVMLNEADNALGPGRINEVLVVLQQLRRGLCDEDVEAFLNRVQSDRIVRACRSCLNWTPNNMHERRLLSGVKMMTASPAFLSSIACLSAERQAQK